MKNQQQLKYYYLCIEEDNSGCEEEDRELFQKRDLQTSKDRLRKSNGLSLPLNLKKKLSPFQKNTGSRFEATFQSDHYSKILEESVLNASRPTYMYMF